MLLNEEALRERLARLQAQIPQRSLMEVKAEMIALILENAQLPVREDGYFVARFGNLGIMEALRKQLRKEVCQEKAAQQTELACLLSATGSANPGVDNGHIGPDWDYLMARGVVGVIEDLKLWRQKNPGKEAYYDSCILVYEAVAAFLARWAKEARKIGNSFVAENLEELSVSAPKTLGQAMQLTLSIYRLTMDLDYCLVRSLGGLDHLYAPFYDPEKEAQQRALVRHFLMALNGQHAVANLPFYVGDAEGNCNEFTFLLLEEYRALGLFDPKIHVMYHPQMDKKLVRFVLESIREGKSSFVFINAPVARASLEHIGISPRDAKRLTVYGCYEYAAEGTEIPCTCGAYVNMAKALELALNDGIDPISGQRVGPATGTEFLSFEALLAAVKTQLEHLLERTMEVLAAYDGLMGDINPSLFMSPTYESSRASGLELYHGGAKYNNTSLPGVGLATLVDSLMAIRQVVFEKAMVTLEELKEILKNNWEGQQRLRSFCKGACKKYGNNDPEADGLAVELVDLAANMVNGRENGRGGVFRWGQFSVNIRDSFGQKTGATADGRLAGQPLSKNVAASIGADKKGVTALLSSVLKLKADRIPDGVVADVVLHHSAVKGEAGMAAFEGLLTTFMAGGGGSVHFNVLSPEVLRKAQADPEKYQNLQIRLCGWNVRFVTLSKREQDEFILQAEKEAGA